MSAEASRAESIPRSVSLARDAIRASAFLFVFGGFWLFMGALLLGPPRILAAAIGAVIVGIVGFRVANDARVLLRNSSVRHHMHIWAGLVVLAWCVVAAYAARTNLFESLLVLLLSIPQVSLSAIAIGALQTRTAKGFHCA